VCGKLTYEEIDGYVEIAPNEICVQLEPDIGYCSSCSFSYSQHVDQPFDE